MVQGIYFFLTGAWSIVHTASFQKVTGRKTDLWLVKAMGALIVTIGFGLFYSGMTYELSPGLLLIAVGSSLCLLVVDLVYVLKRVISPLYIADAVVEFVFTSGWALCLVKV
jgi:hypothetical protein